MAVWASQVRAPGSTLGLAGAGQGSKLKLGKKTLNFHPVPSIPNLCCDLCTQLARPGGCRRRGELPFHTLSGATKRDSDGTVFPILLRITLHKHGKSYFWKEVPWPCLLYSPQLTSAQPGPPQDGLTHWHPRCLALGSAQPGSGTGGAGEDGASPPQQAPRERPPELVGAA